MATYADGSTVPTYIDATTQAASQNSDPATGAGHGDGLSAPNVRSEVAIEAVRNNDTAEQPESAKRKK